MTNKNDEYFAFLMYLDKLMEKSGCECIMTNIPLENISTEKGGTLVMQAEKGFNYGKQRSSKEGRKEIS